MWMSAATVASNRPSPLSEAYVLLVDDHAASLERLRLLVEDQGYRCRTAASAGEAMERCGVGCPWLVVTDLNMPRLDGRALAAWLKTRCPGTPVVLLTSECLDAEALELLDESFAAILSKPLDVTSFLRLLGELSFVKEGSRDS